MNEIYDVLFTSSVAVIKYEIPVADNKLFPWKKCIFNWAKNALWFGCTRMKICLMLESTLNYQRKGESDQEKGWRPMFERLKV